MKQLFDDPLFQMFAERAIMTMTRGGAEYGECEATAARISRGDVDSWYREWIATAERVAAWGDDSAKRGHRVSAQRGLPSGEHLLSDRVLSAVRRACRSALVAAFDRETQCFDRFAALMEPPLVQVEVPFEGTSLPGYLCLVDDFVGRQAHARRCERLRFQHSRNVLVPRGARGSSWLQLFAGGRSRTGTSIDQTRAPHAA